jgi:signal transduction histidine kinase
MGLRRQLLIPPLLLLLLALGLIAFSGQRVLDIRAENELMREFNLAVADAEAAQAALGRLDVLVDAMSQPVAKDLDELHFRYLDVYRDFALRLQNPNLQESLTDEARAALRQLTESLDYSDHLDVQAVSLAIAEGGPVLDAARRALWVHKRDVYDHYYASVQAYTGQLSMLYVAFLAVCLLVGVPLVVWAARTVDGRIRRLAQRVDRLVGGEGSVRGDPLDGLDQALQDVERRLAESGGGGQLLSSVDDERRRIALDMHDEVLSGITGLIRETDALRAQAPEAAQQLRTGLETLSGDIRRVIDDLHPPVLDTLGWEAALQAYLARIAELPGTPEVLLNVESRCADGLDDARRATVYRILREVVNNVLRHARASRLEIDCHRDDGGVVLVVDDNGDGRLPLQEGRGISGIRYRAAALGGEVQWLPSRFSSGLRFTLSLPGGCHA